jgi:hypothetical protein
MRRFFIGQNMIVGDMEIRLRADIARLSRDLNDARLQVGGAMSSIERSVNIAKAAFFALAGALSMGAIAGMISQVRQAAVDIERLAAMAGSTNKEFQRFAAGSKFVGFEMDKFSDIIKDVQDKLGEFMTTGGGEMKDFFEKIAPKVGVTAEQFKNLSGPQALQLYYTTLEKAGVGQKVMITQMEALANDASMLAPLLANGGAAFQKIGDDAQKSGYIMSDALVNASKIWDLEIKAMKMQVGGIGNAISEFLVPEIAAMSVVIKENIAGGFQSVSKWVEDNKVKLLEAWTAAKALGDEVWRTVSGAAALLVGIVKLGIETGALKTIFESIGLMVAGFQDGVKILGAGFAALGSVIYKSLLTPVSKYLEVIGKVNGFIGRDESAKYYADTAASIKQFANEGTVYAAEVVKQFSLGDTAVARFAENLGKAKKIVLGTPMLTSDALRPLGQGEISKNTDAQKKAAAAAAAAINQEASAYIALITPIRERIAAGKLELLGYDQLTEAQKMTIKLDAAIGTGKNKLSEPHIKLARDLIAVVAAQDLVNASNKFYADQAEAKLAADGALIQSAQDEADRNVELARTFGMTKSAIEGLELARLQERLAQQDGTLGYTAEIAKLEELIAAKKRSMAAMAALDDKESAKKATDDRLAEQVKMWESIDQTAHDTFVSIFDSGKSAFDRLRDSLKNGLLDLLYQMTVKKWIFQISAAVTGGGVAGTAQAAGTSLLGSAASSALMSMGTSMGVTAATSAIAAYGSGVAMSIGSTSGAAMAASLATSGNLAAGAASGVATGTAVSTALAAIPVWGWVALGGIAIASWFGGKGDKEVTNRGIEGTVGGGAFTGNKFENWKQDGGWFSSDSSGHTPSALDAATAKQLTQTYAGLQGGALAAANALGLSTAAITNYSQKISVDLSGKVEDAAKDAAAIAAMFDSVGNNMAAAVAPGIAALAKDGEVAGVTLARLSGSITTANSWLSVLRQRLFQVSLAGGDAASKLADAFGGLDKLAAASKSFYDLYYSEGERAARSQEDMTAALAKVNLALPDTMAHFRDLTAAMDLNTDAGRAAYTTLLLIAPEFASVAEITAKMAQETADTTAKMAQDAADAVVASTAATAAAAAAAAEQATKLAQETADKLMAAYTGRGLLLPALDTMTLQTLLLTDTLTDTYTAAGNISTIFLDVTSGLITFGSTTESLTDGLTGAQTASLLLNSEIDSLRLGAASTRIDFAGLGTALANVDTETFVLTMGLVFDNLASRISGVIDSISTERIALREAALQIANPTVMSKAAIQSAISSINTTMPGNAAVLASLTSLNALAKQQSTIDASRLSANDKNTTNVANTAAPLNTATAAVTAAQAKLVAATAAAAPAHATANTTLSAAITARDALANILQEGNGKYWLSSNVSTNAQIQAGAIYSGTQSNVNFSAQTQSYEYIMRKYNAENTFSSEAVKAATAYKASEITAETAAQSAATAATKALATAQTTYATASTKDAAAYAAALAVVNTAQTTLTTKVDAANEVAKKAQIAYTAALQDFAIDASKSVSKLSKLREETVKYYDTQKQLADLMSSGAAGLRGTVADIRYGQMTDAQQFANLQASYATAYSMALSTDGEALAGYGSTLSSALNPMLEKAKEVLSDASYATFAATAISRAEAIATRLETLTPTNYAADSLLMLGQIDATLAALDASSKSAERIIADAVNAGSDKTAGGLHAVIAALTGQAIPAFVLGGNHAGGLRLVGENGPELEVTGPSRIFNAAQTRGMLSGGNGNSSTGNTARLEALVEQQNQEMAAMRAELRAIATSNAKMARLADRVYVEGALVRTDADMPLQTAVAV